MISNGTPQSPVHPLILMDRPMPVLDFSKGYNPDIPKTEIYGIGGYAEKRENMYLAPHFAGKRNIHMGIDIWMPAGTPVYAIRNGRIAYLADHNEDGNYGATIVTEYNISGKPIFALHGHLSKDSLRRHKPGDSIHAGDVIAELGEPSENGNWPPHLHFQISPIDPGEADMPGVVSGEEFEEACKCYPDPRTILGPIY